MNAFVNNPDSGGASGVRYKASTMHALGWVLRHTYPFMAVNRGDSNNEVWSRVAGQFAMREVIKQLKVLSMSEAIGIWTTFMLSAAARLPCT